MARDTARPSSVLGLDVGKRKHWAFLLGRDGEIGLSSPVANSEKALDALFAKLEPGTLVVVDQVRNIGALAISRARRAGLPVAYLTGTAEHQAAKMMPGEAKSDERDAEVIARTALGMPWALLGVPEPTGRLRAARSLAAQRDHVVTCATRDKNRLRSVLLESCPAFEALCDLSDPHWVNLLEKLGGPWGIADAGKQSFGAVTRGADRGEMDAAWEAIGSSTRPDAPVVDAENPHVKMLARRIREDREEKERLDSEIASLLDSEKTYRCLLTVPGIGPRAASELVIGIDISLFPDHDHLASYCGLAPVNRQSGTSISSVAASRRGSKRLKNVLIFTCNSLVRGSSRYAAYYEKMRSRGKSHGAALKAVARKRLKVIYAIMRDGVPYAA